MGTPKLIYLHSNELYSAFCKRRNFQPNVAEGRGFSNSIATSPGQYVGLPSGPNAPTSPAKWSCSACSLAARSICSISVPNSSAWFPFVAHSARYRLTASGALRAVSATFAAINKLAASRSFIRAADVPRPWVPISPASRTDRAIAATRSRSRPSTSAMTSTSRLSVAMTLLALPSEIFAHGTLNFQGHRQKVQMGRTSLKLVKPSRLSRQAYTKL